MYSFTTVIIVTAVRRDSVVGIMDMWGARDFLYIIPVPPYGLPTSKPTELSTEDCPAARNSAFISDKILSSWVKSQCPCKNIMSPIWQWLRISSVELFTERQLNVHNVSLCLLYSIFWLEESFNKYTLWPWIGCHGKLNCTRRISRINSYGV